MASKVAIQRSRVVIIGAGFGGLSAAKALTGGPFNVTLVDRYNYHLFQPLLYQVATAALSPADIAWPIRTVFRRRLNVSVVLANVSGINAARNEVIGEGHRIPFDYLIVATGAQQAYFGHVDWAQHAPGLKTIDDATYLRRRILLAFEKAETEPDADERRRLLNFVVVGGGPTGVELAGAIAELAKRALASDFRTIDPRSARIVLVEAGPRVLSQFDGSLSRSALRALEQLGAEVRLGTEVTGCDDAGISMGKDRIESRTIMWAAGVEASPAGQWLGAESDRAGRVKVEPDLSLPGRSQIFVVGDTAFRVDAEGMPLPGLASVAKQQGAYVARAIAARAAGRSVPPFQYRDYGMLATIGRSHAVAQVGRIQLSGLAAWLLWCLAHIYFLIGFRNRLLVMVNWAWSFATFQRGARLITGIVGAQTRDVKPEAASKSNAREVA
ncbi:MAG: NAD(P)/FAD-dependent oxidoreductase [Xanthobacteraceae bacterium]|jgi:NADH dehydrogenase